MNNNTKFSGGIGTASVLLAAFFWGSMGCFARYLNAYGLGAFETTQIRITVGFVAISIYLLIFHRDLFKIKLKDLWCFLGTGIVSLLFFSVCYFKSLEYVTVSTATILLYTSPIFVMLMSIVLFKEKLTVIKGVALLSAFCGCILVSGVVGGGANKPIGIILALCSGVFFSFYSIFSRYAIMRGYSSLTVVFYTFLFSSVGCSFLCDWKIVSDVVFVPDIKVILLSVGLGFVTGFLPYVLYSKGLELMESSKASIMASIEPVVATLFGVFLFKEKITVLGVIGIVLVLASVIMLSINPHKENNREIRTE